MSFYGTMKVRDFVNEMRDVHSEEHVPKKVRLKVECYTEDDHYHIGWIDDLTDYELFDIKDMFELREKKEGK